MAQTHRVAVALLVVLTAWFSTASHAVLRIEIKGGVGGGLPIAVVPFGIEGNVPEDIAEIVANDLFRTGRFDPVARENMISSPVRSDDVRFDNWKILQVDYLIVGRVKQLTALDFQVTFELIDVFRQQVLTSVQYNPRRNQLRRSAHKIADAVVEALLGTPGAFDTNLVYVSVKGDSVESRRFELQVSDSDGANPASVVSQSKPLMSPAWSPDGGKLAYVSFENPRRTAIFVQDRYTGQRQQLASFEGINGAPAWSPDGRQIAVTLSLRGSPDLYVINVGSGDRFQLTNNPAIETEPAWSPDGRFIYFTSDRAGGPQIYRIPAQGGTTERMTFEGKYNASPAVSPNGKLLAMVHQLGSDFRIAVLDLESNLLDVLTSGRLDESPSFAPNSEMIIYATEAEGRGVLGAVSADGAIKLNMPLSDGDVREPAWSPTLP
ncbi:MAG: Tol-Pal system beta propeller repeat protein TolB [Pseudomonadota bacterium]